MSAISAVHGKYGFKILDEFPPFADPMKVINHLNGINILCPGDAERTAIEFCEASGQFIGAVCVNDEYFDDAWRIAVGCIAANWPRFPREKFPDESRPIQERREWAHSQISMALMLKEMLERNRRNAAPKQNLAPAKDPSSELLDTDKKEAPIIWKVLYSWLPRALRKFLR